MSTQMRKPVRLRVSAKPTRLAVGAGIMMIAAGCGTDSPTGPKEATAFSIGAVSPILLTGTVGTVVEPAPTVIVKDEAGRALAGVRVEFAVAAGGGSVYGQTQPPAEDATPRAIVVTDASGVASASWVLGTSIDPRLQNQLVAQAPGLGQVRFTATAKPGAPAQLRKLWSQAGPLVGGFVVEISAQVGDAYGNPIARVPVTFTVTAGGGDLNQGLDITTQRATTNVAGVARMNWILGSPGENTVTASFEDLDPVTFSARVLDPGTFTWYDLEVIDGAMQSIQNSYIGLDPNGLFAWQTIWVEGFSSSLFGIYEITESRIALVSGGQRINGLIDGDHLVLELTDDFDLPSRWIYRKRGIAP